MVDVMTLRFEGMDTDLGAPAVPGTDVVEVGPAGAAPVTDEKRGRESSRRISGEFWHARSGAGARQTLQHG